jgi:hypothetical protein
MLVENGTVPLYTVRFRAEGNGLESLPPVWSRAAQAREAAEIASGPVLALSFRLKHTYSIIVDLKRPVEIVALEEVLGRPTSDRPNVIALIGFRLDDCESVFCSKHDYRFA